MKVLNRLALGFLCAFSIASGARADSVFAGSGPSGTLASPSESWAFNGDGGPSATEYLNNWGSPGTDLGLASYGETELAYGFIISFIGGGPVDPASIALGNEGGCSGTTTGGTTFCTFGAVSSMWNAFLTGPDTIDFLAQDPSASLNLNDFYFANVFFDGATPTAFSGYWLSSFAATPAAITPEPSSLTLLASGLLAAGTGCRRRRRTT